MVDRHRIVVLGEHTPAATEAVRWAMRTAAGTGADVVVVRPFDPAARADLALEGDLERARRDARYRAQAWLVEAVAELDVSARVSLSTPEGPVAQALAAAAQGADLTVIGTDDPACSELATYVRKTSGCPVRLVSRPVPVRSS